MPCGRYMEQEVCDWCFDELSAESMATSRDLALCDLDCCACDRCLRVSAFLTAPNGWTGAQDQLADGPPVELLRHGGTPTDRVGPGSLKEALGLLAFRPAPQSDLRGGAFGPARSSRLQRE